MCRIGVADAFVLFWRCFGAVGRPFRNVLVLFGEIMALGLVMCL